MEKAEELEKFLQDRLSEDDYKTACKLYAEIFIELGKITSQMFEQANESLNR